MPNASPLERALPWVLRAVWIGVLVAGATAIDEATGPGSSDGAGALIYIAFVGWFVGVCSMAVPAAVSLTATRMVAPVAVPVAVLSLFGGATAVPGFSFLALALLATLISYTAMIGRVFVQASAYGDEDRHLLRPPAAYAIASVLSWALWVALTIAAPLALTDGRWIVGGVLAIAAIAGAALGWPRWHRLARRWFVIVPIGLVIHDQLVLAETVMLRRHEIAGIRLAPSETEAADLTGPASGHALEISTTESITAILAATPSQPRGNAIHLRACLVAPSRPGKALTAAAGRRLPVG